MHCTFPSCCGPCDFNLILCSFSPTNFLSFLKHDYQANTPILSFSPALRHLKRKCDLKEMWWPIKIDHSGLLSNRDYLTVSGSFLSMWNWAVGCILLFLLSPEGICTYQQKGCKAVETKGVSCIVLEHVVMFFSSTSLQSFSLFLGSTNAYSVLYSSPCYPNLVILRVFLQASCNVTLSQPSFFSSWSPELCRYW